MMIQQLKLHTKDTGEHVRVALFMGQRGQALACCGTLMMLPKEAEAFRTALALGASEDASPISLEVQEED